MTSTETPPTSPTAPTATRHDPDRRDPKGPGSRARTGHPGHEHRPRSSPDGTTAPIRHVPPGPTDLIARMLGIGVDIRKRRLAPARRRRPRGMTHHPVPRSLAAEAQQRRALHLALPRPRTASPAPDGGRPPPDLYADSVPPRRRLALPAMHRRHPPRKDHRSMIDTYATPDDHRAVQAIGAPTPPPQSTSCGEPGTPCADRRAGRRPRPARHPVDASPSPGKSTGPGPTGPDPTARRKAPGRWQSTSYLRHPDPAHTHTMTVLGGEHDARVPPSGPTPSHHPSHRSRSPPDTTAPPSATSSAGTTTATASGRGHDSAPANRPTGTSPTICAATPSPSPSGTHPTRLPGSSPSTAPSSPDAVSTTSPSWSRAPTPTPGSSPSSPTTTSRRNTHSSR